MGMDDYTKYQQGIIKRYYAQHDSILIQRLSELVTDLYLSEGKKRDKIWKTVITTLQKIGIPQSRIDHITTQADPKLVANLITELQSQK